jgi:hypothetical protein
MSDARAIRACYSEWRMIKSRNALQLVFEVSLEQQEEVLRMLGAPMPGQEKWCGIAVLKSDAPTPAMEDATKQHKSMVAKERYLQMPEWEKARARSVLLCKDKQFQNWLRQDHPYDWHGALVNSHPSTPAEEIAAICLRKWLVIESRKDIATEESAYKAFISLETAFRRATGQMAEVRE